MKYISHQRTFKLYTIHFIFLQIVICEVIFLSTFLRIRRKSKQLFVVLKAGWMLAQHWATCWCRRLSVSNNRCCRVIPNPFLSHQLSSVPFKVHLIPRSVTVGIYGTTLYIMVWCYIIYISKKLQMSFSQKRLTILFKVAITIWEWITIIAFSIFSILVLATGALMYSF